MCLTGPGGLRKEQDLDEKCVGSPSVMSVLIVGGSLALFPAGLEGKQGGGWGDDMTGHIEKVCSLAREERHTGDRHAITFQSSVSLPQRAGFESQLCTFFDGVT